MKLKYLYIIAVVAILNLLNTNTALADIAPGPEAAICPIICLFAITSIAIRAGICGLKYVKEQKRLEKKSDTLDN